MELHTQAVTHWKVPYLGHRILLVLESPRKVQTSTVASFPLVHVEIFQFFFQSFDVEGLQVSAGRLSVGS